MTDPSHKANGKDEAEMPAIRLFRHEDNNWVETNPVTTEKEIVDKEDILDDLDIKKENEDS